jgi:hypothetical protein
VGFVIYDNGKADVDSQMQSTSLGLSTDLPQLIHGQILHSFLLVRGPTVKVEKLDL